MTLRVGGSPVSAADPVSGLSSYQDIPGGQWGTTGEGSSNLIFFGRKGRGEPALQPAPEPGGDNFRSTTSVPPPQPATYSPAVRIQPSLPAVHSELPVEPSPARVSNAPRASRSRTAWRGNAEWVAPGRSITVAGHRIPGGMVWLGTSMTHAHEQADPALLNPLLAVDSRPDWSGKNIDYWPSYTTITARQRCAYLIWLSEGRRSPGAPISYVFMFFYGLERRVLDAVDTRTMLDPSMLAEMAVIQHEIAALRDVYPVGAAESTYLNSSFDRYASALHDLVSSLILVGVPTVPSVPDRDRENYWQIPIALRVGLGRMARDGIPVSAQWALAWVWYHPRIYARTPQRRCRAEFDALFTARYTAQTGSGLRLVEQHSNITIDYQCATNVPRSGPVEFVSVPDVVEADDASQLLAELAERAENDLDPFSRWLGRHPDDRTSFGALATVPAELLDTVGNTELAKLKRWADTALAGRTSAVTDSRPLIRIWGDAIKFLKADAVAAATLLQNLGYGIEPDVRCGSPVLIFGPMVVFRASAGTPQTAGQTYAAATLIAHLGVAVAASDGHVEDVELNQITHQLRSALDLTVGEHQRLAAHIAWLVAAGVKLTGLKKRLDPLTVEERETLADFVADVAAADGVVTATESKALDRIHLLLELDPAGAARRLHNAMTTRTAAASKIGFQPASGSAAGSGSDELVTVRAAASAPPDHRLPHPPKPDPAVSIFARPPAVHGGDSPVGSAATPEGFRLDENLIAVRLADTASVAALLTRIFDDQSGSGDTPAASSIGSVPGGQISVTDQSALNLPATTSENSIGTLSDAYRALLDGLGERTVWYRVEFDRLAAGQGLVPGEARDVLNASATAVVGRELLSGVERLYIDEQVLAQLLIVAPRWRTDLHDQLSGAEVVSATGQAVSPAAAAATASGYGRVVEKEPDASRHGDLDAVHSALLDAVAAQSHWYRVQFEHLAAGLGLLPDAALEQLNDSALDLCDDLVIDGAEQLTVNEAVLKEMLR